MRVPTRLTGGLDIAVHDAFWAALLAVSNHATPITTIAAPGFGTGFGQVPAARAAQLMSAAHTVHRLPATTAISQRELLF